MLLEGKKLLITGVLTRESIAYAAARSAQEHGAEIALTSFGRAMGLTEKSAKRLPHPVDVLEMDATNVEHVRAVAEELGHRWGRVDGFLHAIAFAPQDALGGNFLHTPWDSVGTAVQVSAFSLKTLAEELLPHMRERGGAIVSLDFDARFAWPVYDWMGVAKAALESVTRYLARDLGPARRPCEHALRGTAAHDRRQGDPGVPGARRRMEGPCPARLGRRRRLAGGRRGRVPALGSGARCDGRDAPRRRWVPRDRLGAGARCGGVARGRVALEATAREGMLGHRSQHRGARAEAYPRSRCGTT